MILDSWWWSSPSCFLVTTLLSVLCPPFSPRRWCAQQNAPSSEFKSDLFLDLPVKSWQSKVFPLPVLMKIHSFLLADSWHYPMTCFLLLVKPFSAPLQAVPALPLATRALISCTGRRTSPSVIVAASICSTATSCWTSHLTRRINAQHTSLLITTDFKFQNCQNQYSGAII